MTASDDEALGTLRARLADRAGAPETPFEPPVGLSADGTGAFLLPGPVDAVVEPAGDGEFPRRPSVVSRARARASALDAPLFATGTATDLFVFRTGTEGPAHYVDRRDAGDAAALLDAVRAVAERDELPSQSERDRLVGLLRSYHAAVEPTYAALAREAHGRDEAFTRALDAWADDRDGTDDRFDAAARRYAFLLACEAVRDDVRGSGPVDDAERRFRRRLRSTPVADCFGAFPGDGRTRDRLDALRATVDGERVVDAGGDVLGTLHERLAAADERRERGQFYTHPTVAEAVCRWAVVPGDDGRLPRVLDPATGSGTFAAEAAAVLAERSDDAAGVAERLAAVDVDRVSLYLTELRLDCRGAAAAGEPELYHGSFFDVEPVEVDGRERAREPVDDGSGADAALGRFDAVVGNPPYVRQEALDKERVRAHLASFGPPDATPYADGSKRLSRRSDAYVYFVTHATRFLREGGRLGFVVPTKWLTTRYGEPFQEFLAEFYAVEAVVGFGARAFEDALVDAALLLVERRADPAARRSTTTNFVRVDSPVDAATLLDAAETAPPVPADAPVGVRSRAATRTVAVEQGRLMDDGGGKLAPYLRAPPALVRLAERPGFTELGDLAETRRGVTTGANDFFLLDDADRERWDLPERFCRPALKSIRDADGRVVREADADRYLFDVHDYVRRVDRATDATADLEARVAEALARDGHDATRRYVEWGESEGFHERSTCAARRVWFDLGALDAPAVLHPKFFDERVFALWNPDRLVPTNAVDCVRLDDDVDEAAAVAALDSTVHKAMLECWGRAEGGGALQLMTYELASLPVLDVRALDRPTRERLAAHHERLLDGAAGAQRDLDAAVLDALDASLSVERLRTLREEMVRRRLRGGDEAAVLVGDR